MTVPFRQGIVSCYQVSGLPAFLQPGSLPGFVNLNVSPEPTIVNFAHGASDYLQVFDADVIPAWGPIQSGVNSYLYWEIDLITANVSYKITTVAPVTSLTAPLAPVFDTHWFDLTTTTMKYWNGTKWVPKIAVFAGIVMGGSLSNIVSYTPGSSQVGLNTPSRPGFIIRNTQLKPIYQNPGNWEFLTSETSVRIQTTAGTSGVLAVPPNAFVPVRAGENIPRFRLVYFSGPDTVSLASGSSAFTTTKVPVGVITEDLSTNELGAIVQSGEVTSDDWDWSAHIGQPLYCGPAGEIITTRPVTLLAYRVGFVKNATTILFNVDAETNAQVYTATVNDTLIEGIAPILVPPATVTLTGERIWTVSITPATTLAGGYMTAAQALALEDQGLRLTTAETDILGKTDIGHLHAIADVSNLQTELDGKSNVGHNHDTLYSPLGHTHVEYALVAHTHTIAQVLNLQTALNDKADQTFVVTGLAGKAAVIHTHVIDDVTGLQTRLDDIDTKAGLVVGATVGHLASLTATGDLADSGFAAADFALSGHGHVIADVTNLQPALDDKADLSYVNTQLGLKENAITAGTVNQYWRGDKTFQTLNSTAVGLGSVDNTSDLNKPISTATQTALNNKVDRAGDTMTGLLVLSADPVALLGAATKQYVDTADGLKVNRAGDTMTGGLTVPSVVTATVTGVVGGPLGLLGAAGTTIGGSVDIFPGNASTGIGGSFGAATGTGPTGSGNIELLTTNNAAASGNITLTTGTGATPGFFDVRTNGVSRLNIGGNGSWTIASSTGTVGQVLTSAGAGLSPTWETVAGGVTAIDDLSDVDTTTGGAPVVDEVLKWNGTNWVPGVSSSSLLTSTITI